MHNYMHNTVGYHSYCPCPVPAVCRLFRPCSVIACLVCQHALCQMQPVPAFLEMLSMLVPHLHGINYADFNL